MDTKTIIDILQSFREDLPDHSQTAIAIDGGASLADISNHAQAEGLHEIVTVLFEALQEAVRDNPEYRFPEKGVHYAAKGSGDDSIFAMTFATDLVVHLKGCAC